MAMNESRPPTEVPLLTPDALDRLTLDTAQRLTAVSEVGKDRVITPHNVYQPAVLAGRDLLREMMNKVLLPGSKVEGLEHLDDCLARLERGESVIFLPEHRGNMDVLAFYTLLEREHPRYGAILDRLVYIAGRKLNESSQQIKMFTERYSRLVIVPKRELPQRRDDETPEELKAREEIERHAAPINRAAFREMVRLKREGMILVLFPLGGRYKPGQDNTPVKETTSYLSSFDTAYLVSMDGNPLPPQPRMEDERPVQVEVLFRVSPALDTAAFLAAQKKIYAAQVAAHQIPAELDYEQHTVNHLMTMLERLRLEGSFD